MIVSFYFIVILMVISFNEFIHAKQQVMGACQPGYNLWPVTYYTPNGDFEYQGYVYTYDTSCSIAYINTTGAFGNFSMFRDPTGTCFVTWNDCTNMYNGMCGIYNGYISSDNANCIGGPGSNAWQVASERMQKSRMLNCQGKQCTSIRGDSQYFCYACFYGGVPMDLGEAASNELPCETHYSLCVNQ